MCKGDREPRVAYVLRPGLRLLRASGRLIHRQEGRVADVADCQIEEKQIVLDGEMDSPTARLNGSGPWRLSNKHDCRVVQQLSVCV